MKQNSSITKLNDVSVADTGTGIDSSLIPRLFTKFASGAERGEPGYVCISKSILEAYGGKIWGENNPNGIGATFAISLPSATETRYG